MKREREGLTVLLLDVSGSMAGREQEIIEAVNSFPTATRCYTFNETRVPFTLPLTCYEPRGGTCLYDAICDTMKEDQPTTLVIATDGHDSTSVRYTLEQAKMAIRDIDTVFLADGFEAESVGADLGLTVNQGDLSASLRAYSQTF